jgi:hypothetical protein
MPSGASPKAWERRYYRNGPKTGFEVMLIMKSNLRGVWIVLTPRLVVTTMNLSATSAVSATPRAGTQYQPMPVLTQAQKDSAKTAASSLLAGGITSAELGAYRGGGSFGSFLGLASVLHLFTGFLGRPMRSLRRMAFTLGVLGFAFVLLNSTGVIDAIGMFFVGVYGWGLLTWNTYWESYENLVLFGNSVGELAFQYNVGVREVGILILSLILVLLGGQFGKQISGDDSGSDSSGGSGPGSPSLSPTPMAMPQDATTALLVSATAALQDITANQNKLAARVEELAKQRDPDASKAAATGSPSQGPTRDSNPLDRLNARVDAFEDALRSGAGKGSPGARAPAPTPVDPTGMPAAVVPLLASLPTQAGEGAGLRKDPEREVSAQVSGIVKQLEAGAKNVQAAFVEELRRYKDIAAVDWPLPPGYQQRLAPAFFAEVYRSGQTGEKYAQDFRRSHGLEDCLVSQEIDSILSNFDRMLLVDNEPGFINRVSTEYAARRAFGLIQAFKRCRKRDDWAKPKNAPASWKTKVDWDELDRLDPRASEALPASFRAVENEMRTELERDALLIKAKAKMREAMGSEVTDRLNS